MARGAGSASDPLVAPLLATAGAVSPMSGKWQATKWSGSIARTMGSSSAQRSWARGQRVRKRQPDGGNTGDGISPSIRLLGSGRTVGSGTGIDLSRMSVYGWAGRAYSVSAPATSHSLPRYITPTRSLTFLTTARSWAMNMSVSP